MFVVSLHLHVFTYIFFLFYFLLGLDNGFSLPYLIQIKIDWLIVCMSAAGLIFKPGTASSHRPCELSWRQLATIVTSLMNKFHNSEVESLRVGGENAAVGSRDSVIAKNVGGPHHKIAMDWWHGIQVGVKSADSPMFANSQPHHALFYSHPIGCWIYCELGHDSWCVSSHRWQ